MIFCTNADVFKVLIYLFSYNIINCIYVMDTCNWSS